MNGELLTPTVVAKMLGITRVTVIRWQELGIMPKAILMQGNYRFRKTEVENWIAKGCPSAFKPKPVKEKFVNEDGEIVENVGYYSPANFDNIKINNVNPFKDPPLDHPTGTGKTELPPDSINPRKGVK
jgi:predicted DNA-binding transcriptional regulator AlpA